MQFRRHPASIDLLAAALLLAAASTRIARATENVPHEPFGRWADLPARGEWVVGVTYQESESYHIWANGTRHYVDFQKRGEHYGIDITQGYLSLQYGINGNWALDLSAGAATTGWRVFANDGTPGTVRSTTGLMDTTIGVRYQICREGESNAPAWLPTLAFRAGAVLPGTYEQNFPFAPGIRSASVEPEFIARKHFGWTGFGAYADGLYRWNRTTGNDQYIIAFGLMQQIKNWELDAGFRHMHTLSGTELLYDPSTGLLSTTGSDPTAFSVVREINSSIEAGFSYTTSKRHIRFSFYTRTVVDGNNSDQKFWIGGGVEVPFGGKH